MRRTAIPTSLLLWLCLVTAAFAQTPAACNIAAAPGVSQHELASGGITRSFRLYVPPTYDGRTPLPLVLDLHGSGDTAAGQAANSRFELLAAREAFVVATLQADAGRWNFPVTAGRPSDVQYASDVIDTVAALACIDTARVYAAGFSGGARMSSLLACELGERIAAIAPMAGLRWPGSCTGRAMPLLTLHGLADPQNTYDGHIAERGAEWLESIPEALEGWSMHNGCSAPVVFEDPPGPLSILRYAGCRDGAEVRLIRIDDLAHQWARNQIDATAVMWDFFRQHALP